MNTHRTIADMSVIQGTHQTRPARSRWSWMVLLGSAAFVAALGVACGESSGDDDDDDGEGTDESNSHKSDFSCCLNGAGYTCPDKAAFDKCAGFDFGACISACAPSDGECHAMCGEQASEATHDPSDCDPDPNAAACFEDDPTGGGPSGGGTTGSGSCTPNAIGCSSSFECCEGLTCKSDPNSGTNGTFCLQ